MTPPWDRPEYVSAALDLITDVRDLDPLWITDRIAEIPPRDLASLAVTLAAMVDPDRRARDLLTDVRLPAVCSRGHVMTPDDWRLEGRLGHRRCRICDRERQRSTRQSRRSAGTIKGITKDGPEPVRPDPGRTTTPGRAVIA